MLTACGCQVIFGGRFVIDFRETEQTSMDSQFIMIIDDERSGKMAILSVMKF